MCTKLNELTNNYTLYLFFALSLSQVSSDMRTQLPPPTVKIFNNAINPNEGDDFEKHMKRDVLLKVSVDI